MSPASKPSQKPEEKKSTPTDKQRAYARRIAASKSGNEHFNKRRLQQRFKIPDAHIVCERRNMIGLWKAVGPPCIVKDLGIGGASFLTHGANVKPGCRNRLALQVPRRPTLHLRGRVTHFAPQGPHSHVCGVTFTDYAASAWAVLCDLYNEHAGNLAASPEQVAPSS